MTPSIAEAIACNVDLDIIQSFDDLPSQTARTQVIEQVADVCRQQQSSLYRHRCLVILATLLERLATAAFHADQAAYLALFKRCSDYGWIAKPSCDPAEMPLASLASHLCSGLRARATSHLGEAVAELCPEPRGDFAATASATWSLRKASVHILAPVRLDLGMGGISDIPPYSLERYGNCINVPVRLNGRFPLEARARWLARPMIRFASRDLGVISTYRSLRELEHQPASLLLHREAVRFLLKRILDFKQTETLGDLLRGGLHLETYSHLPVGTGLGVSSLLLCTILHALCSLFDLPSSAAALFVATVYLENVAGIGGGWEDGTAIYPGVKLMESYPETPLLPRVKRLALSNANMQRLKENLVLVYTGIPKQGAFFDAMIERYCLREARTLQAIERNNALNRQLAELLAAGDMPGIGTCMQAQWENWKILTMGKCSNPQIDRLLVETAPYAYGARMNGAGQGGCAMFVAREGKKGMLCRTIQAVLGDSVAFLKWTPVL